jgi:hypothetical protein
MPSLSPPAISDSATEERVDLEIPTAVDSASTRLRVSSTVDQRREANVSHTVGAVGRLGQAVLRGTGRASRSIARIMVVDVYEILSYVYL